MKATSEKSVAKYGVVAASKIIGESVVNRQDEKVGKIHELVIDARKNCVACAVLTLAVSWAWVASCSQCLEKPSSSPPPSTSSSPT